MKPCCRPTTLMPRRRASRTRARPDPPASAYVMATRGFKRVERRTDLVHRASRPGELEVRDARELVSHQRPRVAPAKDAGGAERVRFRAVPGDWRGGPARPRPTAPAPDRTRSLNAGPKGNVSRGPGPEPPTALPPGPRLEVRARAHADQRQPPGSDQRATPPAAPVRCTTRRRSPVARTPSGRTRRPAPGRSGGR